MGNRCGVPRFNMPMELGIHLGARLFGSGRHKRKRALILEAQPHRYSAALSDISGQDIEVHANNTAEAIPASAQLVTEASKPDRAASSRRHRHAWRLSAVSDRDRRPPAARRLDALDELPHSDFLFAVRDWITTRAKAPA
jgi:hypothetical protein